MCRSLPTKMWEFVHQIQELTTFYHQSWEPLRSNSQIWKLDQSISQQRTVESQAVDWVLQFGRDSHRLESVASGSRKKISWNWLGPHGQFGIFADECPAADNNPQARQWVKSCGAYTQTLRLAYKKTSQISANPEAFTYTSDSNSRDWF